MKFQVGDRIRYGSWTGKIIQLTGPYSESWDSYNDAMAVEFDIYEGSFHSCVGLIPSRRGLFVFPTDAQLVENDRVKRILERYETES